MLLIFRCIFCAEFARYRMNKQKGRNLMTHAIEDCACCRGDTQPSLFCRVSVCTLTLMIFRGLLIFVLSFFTTVSSLSCSLCLSDHSTLLSLSEVLIAPAFSLFLSSLSSLRGYLCPAETPEGHACGLVKNFALMCYVSVGFSAESTKQFLEEYGLISLEELKLDTISEQVRNRGWRERNQCHSCREPNKSFQKECR